MKPRITNDPGWTAESRLDRHFMKIHREGRVEENQHEHKEKGDDGGDCLAHGSICSDAGREKEA